MGVAHCRCAKVQRQSQYNRFCFHVSSTEGQTLGIDFRRHSSAGWRTLQLAILTNSRTETRNSKLKTRNFSVLITHHSSLSTTHHSFASPLSLPLSPFPFPPSPFPLPLSPFPFSSFLPSFVLLLTVSSCISLRKRGRYHDQTQQK